MQVDDLGVLPPRHPDTALLLWHKARLYLLQSRFARARHALELAGKQAWRACICACICL
jgi:transposase